MYVDATNREDTLIIRFKTSDLSYLGGYTFQQSGGGRNMFSAIHITPDNYIFGTGFMDRGSC